ncbi:hypothetical protein SeMB42_g06901 [Synchytrium endobioticum]|uniref:Uncharacterized protein n=1 Tax=Synchytrium endobioticum TaxID=286115 RepID=A0A507CD25_9FUNG|nr:hypothetical protein SeMB42_g06901 [Synchytrium endobioticum]
MLVDSQDPPVIRARQPRNMDYVKISGVLIRPTVHLTVVARLASCLSLFAVIFTNSIRGKFQDNPALGQLDIPRKYSVVIGLVGYWSIVSAALTTNVVEVPSKLQTFTKFHISVRVLLTRHAFQDKKSSESEDDDIRVKDSIFIMIAECNSKIVAVASFEPAQNSRALVDQFHVDAFCDVSLGALEPINQFQHVTKYDPIWLRRTEDVKDRNGNPILALPVKNVEEV